MGISWEEVKEADEDRKSWWNRVAQCIFDTGWTSKQESGYTSCARSCLIPGSETSPMKKEREVRLDRTELYVYIVEFNVQLNTV